MLGPARQGVIRMPDEPTAPDDEARQVATATAFLERLSIPANARDFRLRQEFFRHGWDVRVRDEGGAWSVRAVKADRPQVNGQGSTEGHALRRALAAAIGADETNGSS